MTNDMAGSTALVTGATSGIGTAIAMTLAARGAKVLVSGRDRNRGDAVVSEIRGGGGQAEFVYGDLRGAAAAKDLAARSRDLAGGTIDILINNAAIGVVAPTADFPEDGFHAMVATNVESPFYLVAGLAPAMVAQGRGAIVNIASLAGQLALPGMSVYGATKAAMLFLTKSWAAEFGPRGVRVNAVVPGPTRTSGSAELGDFLDALAAQAPAHRVANPDEIAAVVAFLASEEASFIHGAALSADGGRTAV